jgi:O-antigen/teichoic acid export membrane protein
MADGEQSDQSGKLKLDRNRFGWEVLTVGLSRVFMKLASFLQGILIARLLGPEARGLIAALQVPAQLAINFSEMGVRQATAYYLGRGIYPLERLLPTLLMLVPLASGLGMTLSLLYFNIIDVAEGDWLARLLAVAIIPFSLFTSYATGVFLGRRKIAAFNKANWRPALISLLLIAGLGYGFDLGLKGVLAAQLAGIIAGFVYAAYLLSKEGRLSLGFDREVAAKLQRMGFIYAISLFLLMFNYRIMIVMLTQFGTLSDVGLYAQAAAVAQLIWEVPAMVSALLFSRAVTAKVEKDFSLKLLSFNRFAMLAGIGVAGLVAVIAKPLFVLLYGPEFGQSAEICVILLPGVVAFIIFKNLNTDLVGRGRNWISMLISIPALLLNMVLGYFLIKAYGAIGAAYSASLAYSVAAIAFVFIYKWQTNVSFSDILLFRKSDFTLLKQAIPLLRK